MIRSFSNALRAISFDEECTLAVALFDVKGPDGTPMVGGKEKECPW